MLFLIKLRGISRIRRAEVINRKLHLLWDNRPMRKLGWVELQRNPTPFSWCLPLSYLIMLFLIKLRGISRIRRAEIINRKLHLLWDHWQVRKLGWVELQGNPTPISWCLPLSYLIMLFLIKLRGISRIRRAEIINRKLHLLWDHWQVRKLGWVELQRNPTPISWCLPLSYLIMLFLIKLRGISRIRRAEIINRKLHLLWDHWQVRKLGWVELQRNPTPISWCLPLSYLIMLFLIKLRGISRIRRAEIINRKLHLLWDHWQVRKLGWVELQRNPTPISWCLPLSYLIMLFLIKLRGISRIRRAEIINRKLHLLSCS